MSVVRPSILTALVVILLAGLAGSALAEGIDTHTVQSGETLAMIAARHGVSTLSLAAANKISDPDLIWVGRTLLIPGAAGPKASPQPAPRPNPAPASVASVSSYTVKPGQTLTQIAALFGVSSTAIAQANGIDDLDLIASGQSLIIPNTANDAGTAQQTPGTRFVASISQQRCWLYQDGQLIGNWRCSTGRKASPTVPGSYKIQSKINPAYASTWDFWMPYWMGLYYSGSIENGIHGLPYNPKTGRKTWEGLVGTPITYGCIMLDNENARKVYEVAYLGMPVIILP